MYILHFYFFFSKLGYDWRLEKKKIEIWADVYCIL